MLGRLTSTDPTSSRPTTSRLPAALVLGMSLGLAAWSQAAEAQRRPDRDPSIEDILRARPGSERIINGTNAQPGQWPSMAAIYMRPKSGQAVNFCGGSVIDDQWVLTAAHCGAAMKRAGDQARFFIREGTVNLRGGARKDINVAEIVMHPNYDAGRTLNDVALLKLSGKASAPHQKLLARGGVTEIVVPSKAATVIGFGRTSEDGTTGSPDLRQVDVPIVPQSKCQTVYGADRITDATFCAGRDEGGVDSCQGDSGGPIYRPGAGGEQIQIGVVSWGKGCGQAGYPGVYASIGTFETWVKDLVPGATFVTGRAPPAAKPVAATQNAVNGITAGADTAQNPSTLAQLSVDIVQGNELKVGSIIDIRVMSSVRGRLALFNQDSDGRAYQIFPSAKMPGGEGDGTVARIEPGKELALPPPRLRDQGFRFRVTPPTGDNKLIAVVVPDRANVIKLLDRHADGSDIPNLSQLLNDVRETERQSRGITAEVVPVDRAVADRTYRITD